MVMTPDVTPGPRKARLDAGDALPHLLDPLRSICAELSPLHFISVAREVCKLMHVVGISPGESTSHSLHRGGNWIGMVWKIS